MAVKAHGMAHMEKCLVCERSVVRFFVGCNGFIERHRPLQQSNANSGTLRLARGDTYVEADKTKKVFLYRPTSAHEAHSQPLGTLRHSGHKMCRHLQILSRFDCGAAMAALCCAAAEKVPAAVDVEDDQFPELDLTQYKRLVRVICTAVNEDWNWKAKDALDAVWTALGCRADQALPGLVAMALCLELLSPYIKDVANNKIYPILLTLLVATTIEREPMPSTQAPDKIIPRYVGASDGASLSDVIETLTQAAQLGESFPSLENVITYVNHFARGVDEPDPMAEMEDFIENIHGMDDKKRRVLQLASARDFTTPLMPVSEVKIVTEHPNPRYDFDHSDIADQRVDSTPCNSGWTSGEEDVPEASSRLPMDAHTIVHGRNAGAVGATLTPTKSDREPQDCHTPGQMIPLEQDSKDNNSVDMNLGDDDSSGFAILSLKTTKSSPTIRASARLPVERHISQCSDHKGHHTVPHPETKTISIPTTVCNAPEHKRQPVKTKVQKQEVRLKYLKNKRTAFVKATAARFKKTVPRVPKQTVNNAAGRPHPSRSSLRPESFVDEKQSPPMTTTHLVPRRAQVRCIP